MQWLTYGGPPIKNDKKIQKFDFSKVPKLFTHGMGCFGTGSGMLFHLHKGLLVTHEVFEKIEKTAQTLLLLAWGGPLTEDGLENSNFLAVFSIFSKISRVTNKPLYGWNNIPKPVPKQPIPCVKSLELLKKSNFFFLFSWPFFMPTPHNC